MFGKDKKELDIEEKTKDITSEFDDSDIFSDFSGDKKLHSEIKTLKDNEKRDVFDVISVVSSFFKVINFLLLLVIFLGALYTYVQKSDKYSNSPVLDPFCFILLGDVQPKELESCSSVKVMSDFYKQEITNLKIQQVYVVKDILTNLYKTENIFNSKEVVFLRDNKETRLKPGIILEEFKLLKKNFSFDDKSIVCDNIVIGSDNVLTADCDAFVAGWGPDPEIIVYKSLEDKNKDKQNKVYGSSISLANSFLDYLSLEKNFSLIERQKEFISSELNGEPPYTESTNFSIKLKYTNSNLLF